jgi:hypothetical protein
MSEGARMPKPYKIEFELPGLPATVNSMGRKHWTVKTREAKKWRQAVVFAVGSKKPPKPLARAKVRFVRVSSTAIDSDNLAGSFKHVQDGLIDAGVLENDKYANIGMPVYEWRQGKPKQGHIQVTVTEIVEGSVFDSGAAEWNNAFWPEEKDKNPFSAE